MAIISVYKGKRSKPSQSQRLIVTECRECELCRSEDLRSLQLVQPSLLLCFRDQVKKKKKKTCWEADWLYLLCLCFPSWVYLLVDIFLTVLILSSCPSRSFKMLNQAVKKLKWFGTGSHDLNFQHLTFCLIQIPKSGLGVVLKFGVRLLQGILKAFQDFMFTDIEKFW